jgi:hypothetical protein
VINRTLIGWPIVVAVLVLSFTGTVRGEQSPTAALTVPVNSAPHPAPEQPLPFSHRQHVASLHLDCRACHTNPEPGKQMTFPETSICMGCHAAIATGEPAIKKLTEYVSSGQPIPWVRVYTVLPGVTWTHRKHLQSGLKCESCHGSVGELPDMQEMSAATSMASCIGCHQSRHASAQCVTCHAWPKPAPLSSQSHLPASLEAPPP